MNGITSRNTTNSFEFLSSSGTYVLDHLAAHGAGLTGGQVTVVAALQVDAHFLGSLHLEAVHGVTGLGDIDPVVIRVAHNHSLLCFLRKKTLPEESIFCSVTMV